MKLVTVTLSKVVISPRAGWGKCTRLRLSRLLAFRGAILGSIAVGPICLPVAPT